MKRFTAKYNSKKRCNECDGPIEKGDTYLRERIFIKEDGKCYAHSFYYCKNCKA